jgi:hypothetical protein
LNEEFEDGIQDSAFFESSGEAYREDVVPRSRGITPQPSTGLAAPKIQQAPAGQTISFGELRSRLLGGGQEAAPAAPAAPSEPAAGTITLGELRSRLLPGYQAQPAEEPKPPKEPGLDISGGLAKGFKGLKVTWDYLANRLEKAVTGKETDTKDILAKSAEEYGKLQSDPRLAELIRLGDEAPNTAAAVGDMLWYAIKNPTLVANFLAEQVPGAVVGGGVGSVVTAPARAAAVGAATRLGASQAVTGFVGKGVTGAGINTGAVTLQSLGSNYVEGLQKYDGDTEAASQYAVTKTAAEVPANAVAGAFLGFAPFASKFANIGTQVAIQGAGGATGAFQAAEAVGEKASRGEMILEFLGEGAFAPVDILLSRFGDKKKSEGDNINDIRNRMNVPEGRKEIWDTLNTDPKIAQIIKDVGLESPADPNFDEVVAKVVDIARVKEAVEQISPKTPEEIREERKARQEEVAAAFRDTASTGVGVGVGTPVEGVIRRESVQVDEQGRQLVPIGEKPDQVLIPNEQGVSTPAVSGEDIFAAQQGFKPLGGVTIGTTPWANRFLNVTQAQSNMNLLQFGNELEAKLEAHRTKGGVFDKEALSAARTKLNDLRVRFGLERITKWKQPIQPIFPNLMDQEVQIREGKRSKEAGGGNFFFLEARPLPEGAVKPERVPVKGAPKPEGGTPPPTQAAASTVGVSGASQGGSGTTQTTAPAALKDNYASGEAVGAPVTFDLNGKPVTVQATAVMGQKGYAGIYKKPGAILGLEITGEGVPGGRMKLEEGVNFEGELTPESVSRFAQQKATEALNKPKAEKAKATSKAKEASNAAQEGKQQQGDQRKRKGDAAGREEGGRKDRKREAKKPQARTEDSGSGGAQESGQESIDARRAALDQDLETIDNFNERANALLDPAKGEKYRAVRVPVGALVGKVPGLGLIQKSASLFGKEVVFYRVVEGKDFLDGGVIRAGKKIFVNVNATKPHIRIVGHEFAHALQRSNRAAYDRLANSLKPMLDEKGFSDYSKWLESVGEKRADKILEEAIGDIVGDRFGESEFWQMMADRNPTGFKQFAREVINFIDNILKKIGAKTLGSETLVKDLKAARAEVARILSDVSAETGAVADGEISPSRSRNPRSPLFDIVSKEDAEGRIRRRLGREPGVGAPTNERTVLKKGDKTLVVGKITHKDWLDRIKVTMSTEEIKDARAWYQQLDDFLRPLYGDQTTKYVLAWMMSQKRSSPTKGMLDVLRATDLAAGKQKIKIAGLNEKALVDLLQGKLPEGGIGAKLLDFLDSELGKTTRTVVRDDVRGRQPAAIDVWAERDIGFVDQTTFDFLRKTFGEEAVRGIQVDKTTAGEAQYEYGIDFYNDVVEMLNKQKYLGGGWKAAEVQAVGWVTMQKAMGIQAEFVRDIIAGNTRRVSIGLAPGEGSPIAGPLAGKEIPVAVAQKEISYLADLAGIKILQNVSGVGAYLQWIEGSIQIDALASPEAVADFMDMVGYAFQQTEVINTRSLASGKNMAVDVMSKGLKTVDQSTSFFSKFLDFVPKDKDGNPIAPGFQQIVIDGVPGIRLLNFGGNWRQVQVGQIKDALNAASADLDVQLEDVVVKQVVLSSTKNDWKESPDGQAYLNSLRDRGRLQEVGELVRRYPPSRLDIAGEGTIPPSSEARGAEASGPEGRQGQVTQKTPPKGGVSASDELSASRVRETLQSEPSVEETGGTESAAFQRWFGKSKITDGEGNPEVWYHGTAQDIVAFIPKQAGATFVTKATPFAEGFTSDSEDFMRKEMWKAATPEQRLAWIREAIPVAYKNGNLSKVWRERTLEQLKEAEANGNSYENINTVPSSVETELLEILGNQLPSRANIIPVYVRAENPFDYENFKHRSSVRRLLAAEFEKAGELDQGQLASLDQIDKNISKGDWNVIESTDVQNAIRRAGFDSFYVKEGGNKNLAVYNPNQLKSVFNQGTWSTENDEISASRTREGMAQFISNANVPGGFTQAVRDRIASAILPNGEQRFNWWHKSIGTQLEKARTNPYFRRVYDLGQKFLDDTAMFAMRAQAAAPTILPNLGNMTLQFWKGGINKADNELLGKMLAEGTLLNGPSPMNGRVWTDAELRSRYGATDQQIKLYREARGAIDQSLDDTTKSLMAQLARSGGVPHSVIDPLMEAQLPLSAVRDRLVSALGALPPANKTRSAITGIKKMATETESLKKAGYSPLMRFGEFVVSVENKDGDVEYFSLHETAADALRTRNEVLKQFKGPGFKVSNPGARLNSARFKMFAGLSPSTLEAFFNAVPVTSKAEENLRQEYLQLVVSNRSALARMIQRKGTAGYTLDATRTLASFITSNSRHASKALNMAEMSRAITEIPAEQGDVANEAVKLQEYVQNPQEGVPGIRGFLFFNFLGGSIAAGLVNMTQPVMMTYPYLSQWGAARAGNAMRKALKDSSAHLLKKSTGDKELDAALKRAAERGITQPQEMFQLIAAAESGTSSLLGHKFMRVWGLNFAVTEVFNRTVSFTSAFNLGRTLSKAELEKAGVKDAFEFAVRSVEDTQGKYNKGNRPNWARETGVLGAAGTLMFTFKQYSIAYLEFLKQLYKNNSNGKRALGIALGTLILAAGISGLPGADDLDDIIDTAGNWMGYPTNSKKWKTKFLTETLGLSTNAANFLLYGVSYFLPMDLQARLGLANLVPGTGLLNPTKDNKAREVLDVLGPIGGFAANTADAIEMAAKGNLRGAGLKMAPKAVKDLYMGFEMATTGELRDEKGRLVQKVDATEALVRASGFNPQDVASEARVERMIQADIDIVKKKKEELHEKLARAIVDKDPKLKQEVFEDLRKWNSGDREYRFQINMAAVQQRVKKMIIDRSQRFAQQAPKDMRARIIRELREQKDSRD